MSYNESTSTSGQGFRIGEVVSLSFATLRKEFGVMIALSALFYAPMVIFQFSGAGSGGGSMAGALSGILSAIFSFILVAAVTYGTIRSLQGKPVAFGDCVQRGLGRFLPVLGASIVIGLAVGIGTLLLVIPGLIIATLFYVAIPAVVVEEKGVFDSLGRSADLTKGHRWQIFGIIVLVFLLQFGLTLLVELIAPSYDFSNLGNMASTPNITPLHIILSTVVGIFIYALSAIFPAVVYYKLRTEKEGIDVNQIASVFD